MCEVGYLNYYCRSGESSRSKGVFYVCYVSY